MKEKVICGIQQIGIGVSDVIEALKWYMDHFGFNAIIVDDEGVAERMLPYTAGKPQPRRAIMAYNLMGGGGFEVWQPKGRDLNYPEFKVKLGDIGIFICKLKAYNIDDAYNHLKKLNANILSEPTISPSGQKHFFLKDPYNNIFQIEEDDYIFLNQRKPIGGANGAIIGVSDIDKSINFYKHIFDYDTVVYDHIDVFDDLKAIPGGNRIVRRVLIKRSKPIEGPLSEIMGTSHLELVQCIEDTPKKIFENRLWGDPGFIHLCFDIRNMNKIEEAAKELGHEFICDGGRDFDMGDANGHFTYLEDPDGTLIESVETLKIPILKKFGLYLNLTTKDDKKPLPFIITKAMKFKEVKKSSKLK